MSETKQRFNFGRLFVGAQPAPRPAGGQPIWDLVIDDMIARHKTGVEKYGAALTTNNGRDPLIDLYQELLDAVVYVRQELEERYEKQNQQAS